MMPYISESNIKPIEAAWLSVCIRGGAPLWSKSIYHWIITLTKRMSPSCHSTQTHTIFHIKFTAFFVCACVSRLPKDGEGRIKMEGNTRIFYLRIELIEDKERERESHRIYYIEIEVVYENHLRLYRRQICFHSTQLNFRRSCFISCS